MEIWKRNLVVCWLGMFVTAIGMSQIAPVLPLYIKMLGVIQNRATESIANHTDRDRNSDGASSLGRQSLAIDGAALSARACDGGSDAAINTLLKHSMPESITGRAFGFNMSAQYLGVCGGSVL